MSDSTGHWLLSLWDSQVHIWGEALIGVPEWGKWHKETKSKVWETEVLIFPLSILSLPSIPQVPGILRDALGKSLSLQG